MKEILFYITNNKQPFKEWYKRLDNSQRIIVDKRLSKLERGLYGDKKQIDANLQELKFENGLRIYFCERGNTIIILFTGGNKKRQNNDIAQAKEYFNNYIERCKDE